MAATSPSSSLPTPLPTIRSTAPPVKRKPYDGRQQWGTSKYGEIGPTSVFVSASLAASGAHSQLAEEYAAYLDSTDHLAAIGTQFIKPRDEDVWTAAFKRRMETGDVQQMSRPGVYLAGNSLGLAPRSVKSRMIQQLDVWGTKGVLGHTENVDPFFNWVSIESTVNDTLSKLTGSPPSSVVAMGTLTSNLHTLLTSFYRPTSARHKILFEAKAFPSDAYAFASHAQLHDFGPTALIELEPRRGEWTLRTEDILDVIDERGHEIAVVCFSGVQYYTGQLFDIEAITKRARSKGCIVGWDLAHAIGNVPLHLHDWGVDFAAWCSYKYLCGGPGAIAGLFVHERHENIRRLQGWWGHDPSTRFAMPSKFSSQPGAAGWQHSNPSVFSLLPLYEALQIFGQSGYYDAKARQGNQTAGRNHVEWGLSLREKSIRLAEYIEELLCNIDGFIEPVEMAELLQKESSPSEEIPESRVAFTIITPDWPWRGCQLSLLFHPASAMPIIFDLLREKGVLGDERNPGVIRLAPVPLYNTFTDCWRAVDALRWALDAYPRRHEAQKGREQILKQEQERTQVDIGSPSPESAAAGSAQKSGEATELRATSWSPDVPDRELARSDTHRYELLQHQEEQVRKAKDAGMGVAEFAKQQRLEKMRQTNGSTVGSPGWELPKRLSTQLAEKLAEAKLVQDAEGASSEPDDTRRAEHRSV